MRTPDRYREDDEPEPDYEKPTRAEAEAEARDYERKRYTSPPAGAKPSLIKSTDREVASRLRDAADRVEPQRADLAALLREAANRIAEEEPF